MRPVRERLGTNPDLTTSKSPNSEPSGEIRIKTLEEIRQEKAAKSLQSKDARVVSEVPTKMPSSIKKGSKPVSVTQVKTFSEILHEKKKLQEEKAASHQGTSSPESSERPANAETEQVASKDGEIKVKTLEEIRKEKAARMQAQAQATPTNSTPTSTGAKRRILHISKNSCTYHLLFTVICHKMIQIYEFI